MSPSFDVRSRFSGERTTAHQFSNERIFRGTLRESIMILHMIRAFLAAAIAGLFIDQPVVLGLRTATGNEAPVQGEADDDRKEAGKTTIVDLLDRVDHPPVLKESTLENQRHGWRLGGRIRQNDRQNPAIRR